MRAVSNGAIVKAKMLETAKMTTVTKPPTSVLGSQVPNRVLALRRLIHGKSGSPGKMSIPMIKAG
jgi:hypothetical protein